ncbi:hypothetical protein BD324DRAFT_639861 [Kockovaella imperatae]|uniref:HAM1-like N-terminal domain-containing protein n=1 Tax=Kockovaella imperatae TaxID=4999 RepID=A0A1Y1U7H7_9TREE|nr:hypothetical protein BD324DRAFT_639861 [Kockovaella imperatae]ORX33457.1 hypothetical protein BD324DRAFT_639861 [Kockovaella imperatae]
MTSERSPLIQRTGGQSSPFNPNNLPSRDDVRRAIPSKGSRIKVAEAIGAIQAGKLPSQDQLSKLIQLVLDSDVLSVNGGVGSRTARMGAQGQDILNKVKAVLNAVQAWGDEKNGDDLLQNLFWEASTAEVNVDASLPSAPATKKEISKDARRTLDSFQTMASLIVTSSEFRTIVSDAVFVTRDILADAASVLAEQASNAESTLRPDESEREKGLDFESVQQKGKQVMRDVKKGKVQKNAREELYEDVEKVKEYLDDKLPAGEEAKDAVIKRFQQVISNAQKNPDYKRSLTAIVNIYKKYVHKATDAAKNAADSVSVSDEDEKTQQAGRDLKQFIERLANKSLNDVTAAGQKAAEDIRNDEKLSIYFGELEKLFERSLNDPGYAMSQAAYRKASALYDDGQSLLEENQAWKDDAKKLQKEIESVIKGISNDQTTLQLVESVENLGTSLASVSKVGLPSLKFDGKGLYRDVVNVIVPRVVSLLKEIPVPRVEYKSEEIDLVIDDIKLESASFIPDSIRIVQRNDVRFTQGYATYASDYDGTLRLKVDGLHFAASNIAYWINQKSGWPHFEDSGLIDVDFGPRGVSFDVTLENAGEDDRETFFTVQNVSLSMSDFTFHVRDNEHWFASWFAQPILKAFVKRNLTHALEAQVAEYLQTADLRLYGLQQRVIAATNARPTPGNFISAIVNDTIFPRRSSMGPVKVRQAGVVKYGRYGEYVLHVGVDEHLFPDQPPARVSNTQRQRAKAHAKHAARSVRGAADQFKQGAKNIKDEANKVKEGVKGEIADLDARRKEEMRREQKEEGWRSDAFDV